MNQDNLQCESRESICPAKLHATYYALSSAIIFVLCYSIIFLFIYHYGEKFLEAHATETIFSILKKYLYFRGTKLDAEYLGLNLITYIHGALKVFFYTLIPTWLFANLYNFFIHMGRCSRK